MEAVETNQLLSTMFLVAVGILGLLSVGIIYLSIVQWRDRRRRGRDLDLRGKGK